MKKSEKLGKYKLSVVLFLKDSIQDKCGYPIYCCLTYKRRPSYFRTHIPGRYKDLDKVDKQVLEGELESIMLAFKKAWSTVKSRDEIFESFKEEYGVGKHRPVLRTVILLMSAHDLAREAATTEIYDDSIAIINTNAPKYFLREMEYDTSLGGQLENFVDSIKQRGYEAEVVFKPYEVYSL